LSLALKGLSERRGAVKAGGPGDRREAFMAGNGETNGDIKAHAESYERFIGWVKFGALASAIVVAIVVFLISR
jgi:Bacterial aa3 type cytochrome c oxidase subunit IV